jgi:sulfotransferase
MNKTYHMITGLPRSGSTLLSSILLQNPRMHASITDPLATMVRGVIETSVDGPGMRSEVPVSRRMRLVQSLFDGYYADVDKPVVFNTNRAWTRLMPTMKAVFPNSKMIVCVRDIQWILDSFESAHRRHPFDKNSIFGSLGDSVYDRMSMLMDKGGIVEFAYTGVKQSITSAERHMLMLVEYEQLCRNPEGMMRALYNFIEEDYYAHDFNNVDASWDEYDAEIGMQLHKVRTRVEYRTRETILPPDIISQYSNMEVWRYGK